MWLQSEIIMKLILKTIVIMHNMVADDEERDLKFNSIFLLLINSSKGVSSVNPIVIQKICSSEN
jgi:hypothetical protein